LNNRGFSGYIWVLGFFLLIVGFSVGYLSVNMVQWDDSALTGSSIMLLIGALLAVVGVVLLLIGFLTAKSRTRLLYYY
jgi:protein-S-isoprenylcysteine O-methyltransferase Ste14